MIADLMTNLRKGKWNLTDIWWVYPSLPLKKKSKNDNFLFWLVSNLVDESAFLGIYY